MATHDIIDDYNEILAKVVSRVLGSSEAVPS